MFQVGIKKSLTNMKTLILALALLFGGHKSFCQDWIYVSSDIKGDKVFVKSTYVSKGGDFGNTDVIKVWTRRESKVGSIVKNGKEIKVYNVKIMILREYNCSDKTTKLISQTTYNSKGIVIETFKVPDYEQEWTEVVPESIGEAVLDKVCELFN